MSPTSRAIPVDETARERRLIPEAMVNAATANAITLWPDGHRKPSARLF